MTVKEKEMQRKHRILSSKGFGEWWAARQHIHPMPEDPFRAFMIDLSLKAGIHSKEVWRGRTPRADYPSIDLPMGVPAPKRRIPSRKEERRYKTTPKAAMPYGEPTELEKSLNIHLGKMAEEIHIAPPRLVLERGEGSLSSAYYHGEYGSIYPFIKLGVKSGKRAQSVLESVLSHEFGHHVHAKRGLPDITSGLASEFQQSSRIEKEREAWRIADPFMLKQRPVQKFVKKYALGTYIGTTPRNVLGIVNVRKRRKK
jgi:hypothetical protein